jgi:hypothetical protein
MILKSSLVLAAIAGMVLVRNTPLAAEPSPPAVRAIPSAQPVPANAGPKAPLLADKLLTQTCKVLESAKAFSFHAEINFDQVLPSAVKVQFAGAMDFALRRPGELVIVYQSDLGAKQLWFKNGALTIFDPPHLVYATVTVPPTIDEMLEHAAKAHDLILPLSDLAYSDPCKRLKERMIFGGYVGINDVNGIPCDHLALSSSTIDYQLWLQHVGKPIARKIVINYRTEPGVPEYVAVLSDWKFPDAIAHGLFRPRLPEKAKRIDFVNAKEPKP